ncbi:MAG: hypothetical protein IPM45_17825 [Acidimicrobiales bacterium]|nr:hypothetical protein [Acidimicrobiales bacterium]
METQIQLPRPGSLEIRAEGLWADHICEAPFEHWTVGLEAMGLGLEDPQDALGSRRGDIVPLGFDLEWEDAGPPRPQPPLRPAVTAPGGSRCPDPGREAAAACAGYHVDCRVHGEVLVGADRIHIDGRGAREHGWGPLPWWDAAWERGPDGDVLVRAPVLVESRDGRRAHCERALVRPPTGDVAWCERHRPDRAPTGR